MTENSTGQRPSHGHTDPPFLRFCALMAVLGVVTIIAGNIAGSLVVPGHDPVADTISDLAAGRFEIIQDIALYGFAAGIIALALALANLHTRDVSWTIGVLALVAISALVIVIGARNEYGDNDSDGVVIHIYLVYGLGVLMAVAPFALAGGLGRIGRGFGVLSRLFGVAWCLSAPVFFFLPTGIDGAYERGLGVLASAWLLVVARAIWEHARHCDA
jgi:hypothetical protein